MFCRSGHKVECKKGYYLLSYVSEAMIQSQKFGRGDCHAKYPMSSLSFMVRNLQSLGGELYLILQSRVSCAVEVKCF